MILKKVEVKKLLQFSTSTFYKKDSKKVRKLINTYFKNNYINNKHFTL